MLESNLDRRSMLKNLGAGLGIVLAGMKFTEQAGAEIVVPKMRLPYHHIGFPTTIKHEKERYLDGGKVYITDPADDPFRIEWCRWLPESKEPEKIRTQAHIAFQVEDVEAEIAKYKPGQIFAKPYAPFEGVKVGFIDYEGLLVEFLQVTR